MEPWIVNDFVEAAGNGGDASSEGNDVDISFGDGIIILLDQVAKLKNKNEA